MTDKELFEKTQKHFNLTKKSIVVEVFNKGIFNKILNEIRGPKAPTLPAAPAASGGFLSRIAAAIPGTRGHRMRSAEARNQEAKAKSAEVGARFDQQQQMKGIQPPSTIVTSTSGRSTAKPTPTSKPTPPAKPAPVSNVKFKVGDEVFVKTKKNPKAVGTVSAIIDKPGFIQIKVNGGAAYAFDKRNVSLKRGVNKESYKRQS